MTSPEWWRRAVCYQIYPRSYLDTTGDGHGDLQGIIARLDYLKWLGIDALWISPFYPSPNFDWGYDVADYISVDPDFGTRADFDELLSEAHRRGIRILLDLVLNHTSDRHEWFVQSRSGRGNPFRDWYIWRDGKDGGPPNDWEALFGGSAWQLDPVTGQYFYHFFFPEQPDLNWRNPEVKQALFDVMRFWFDRGVDGFRLDAITHIFEREDLADCGLPVSLEDLFVQARQGLFEDAADLIRAKIRYQQHLPETHALMREMRDLANDYPGRVLLGEVKEIEYYGNGSDELHSVFNFDLVQPKLDAAKLRLTLSERLQSLPPGAWDCTTIGNHDRVRSFSLFSDGQDDEARARCALALTLLFNGTPVIYYGEEIGMQSFPPRQIEDVRDGLALWAYRTLMAHSEVDPDTALDIALNRVCRDGCRTPMQWSAEHNAGFTTSQAVPWLPVRPDHLSGTSVAVQKNDPGSMLTFFRGLLAVRSRYPVLQEGETEILESRPGSLVFRRSLPGEACIVALNLTAQPVSLPRRYSENPIYSSSHSDSAAMAKLQAYEIRILLDLP